MSIFRPVALNFIKTSTRAFEKLGTPLKDDIFRGAEHAIEDTVLFKHGKQALEEAREDLSEYTIRGVRQAGLDALGQTAGKKLAIKKGEALIKEEDEDFVAKLGERYLKSKRNETRVITELGTEHVTKKQAQVIQDEGTRIYNANKGSWDRQLDELVQDWLTQKDDTYAQELAKLQKKKGEEALARYKQELQDAEEDLDEHFDEAQYILDQGAKFVRENAPVVAKELGAQRRAQLLANGIEDHGKRVLREKRDEVIQRQGQKLFDAQKDALIKKHGKEEFDRIAKGKDGAQKLGEMYYREFQDELETDIVQETENVGRDAGNQHVENLHTKLKLRVPGRFGTPKSGQEYFTVSAGQGGDRVSGRLPSRGTTKSYDYGYQSYQRAERFGTLMNPENRSEFVEPKFVRTGPKKMVTDKSMDRYEEALDAFGQQKDELDSYAESARIKLKASGQLKVKHLNSETGTPVRRYNFAPSKPTQPIGEFIQQGTRFVRNLHEAPQVLGEHQVSPAFMLDGGYASKRLEKRGLDRFDDVVERLRQDDAQELERTRLKMRGNQTLRLSNAQTHSTVANIRPREVDKAKRGDVWTPFVDNGIRYAQNLEHRSEYVSTGLMEKKRSLWSRLTDPRYKKLNERGITKFEIATQIFAERRNEETLARLKEQGVTLKLKSDGSLQVTKVRRGFHSNITKTLYPKYDRQSSVEDSLRTFIQQGIKEAEALTTVG